MISKEIILFGFSTFGLTQNLQQGILMHRHWYSYLLHVEQVVLWDKAYSVIASLLPLFILIPHPSLKSPVTFLHCYVILLLLIKIQDIEQAYLC